MFIPNGITWTLFDVYFSDSVFNPCPVAQIQVALFSENFKINNSEETTLIRVKDPYGTFNSLLIEKSNQKEKVKDNWKWTSRFRFNKKINWKPFSKTW